MPTLRTNHLTEFSEIHSICGDPYVAMYSVDQSTGRTMIACMWDNGLIVATNQNSWTVNTETDILDEFGAKAVKVSSISSLSL